MGNARSSAGAVIANTTDLSCSMGLRHDLKPLPLSALTEIDLLCPKHLLRMISAPCYFLNCAWEDTSWSI